MQAGGPALGSLKTVRNAAVSVLASALSHVPIFEGPFARAPEHDVLLGMSQTLARLRPSTIMCETPRHSQAERLLQSAGDTVTVLDEIPGGIPNLLFTRGER